VQDRENLQEMTRLSIQDKMANSAMGGVLPELADPTLLRHVLDVGCGTGGWLMETARSYPTIERLVGVDISGKMVAYARGQAQAQQLGERVQFQTMNALSMLEFPALSFDLVNQRADPHIVVSTSIARAMPHTTASMLSYPHSTGVYPSHTGTSPTAQAHLPNVLEHLLATQTHLPPI